MSEYLTKLKQLTPALTDLIDQTAGGIISYKVENGTCEGYRLFRSDKVAIQKAYATAGTIFQPHIHDEYEVVILITGNIEDLQGNRIEAPNTIIIPPHTEHAIKFITDCDMIGITIPASKGYPNGG